MRLFQFSGTTTDLMPTLLGMYDALLDTNKNDISTDVHQKLSPQKTSPVKKSSQLNNFTNLSPTVQKMLANISDQNDNVDNTVNNCTEDHSCKTNIKSSSVQKVSRYLEGQKCMYSSTRIHRLSKYSEQKNMSSHLNKSTECLSAIGDNVTSNVQKMLSNIPDQDLVISPLTEGIKNNCNGNTEVLCDKVSYVSNSVVNSSIRTETKSQSSFLYKIYNCSSNKNNSIRELEEARIGDTVRRATSFNIKKVTNSDINSECNTFTSKSRLPNISAEVKFKSRTIPGNYLQVNICIYVYIIIKCILNLFLSFKA